MPQASVFIDGGYLARILKDLGEPKIDYALLARWAAEGYDLFRTYYYDCLPYQSPNPSNEERQRAAARRRFFTALNRLDRFTVRSDGWHTEVLTALRIHSSSKSRSICKSVSTSPRWSAEAA